MPCGPALPGTQWMRVGELPQVVVADLVAAVLSHRREDELEELLAAQVVERGGHDAQPLDELRLVQVQQARQELALGEVTGGTEEDDGRCWHGPSVA